MIFIFKIEFFSTVLKKHTGQVKKYDG